MKECRENVLLIKVRRYSLDDADSTVVGPRLVSLKRDFPNIFYFQKTETSALRVSTARRFKRSLGRTCSTPSGTTASKAAFNVSGLKRVMICSGFCGLNITVRFGFGIFSTGAELSGMRDLFDPRHRLGGSTTLPLSESSEEFTEASM